MVFYTLAYHELFFLLNFFCLLPGSRTPSRYVYTVSTIFGRMAGFELELLRQQPGVHCATIGLRLTHELEVNMMPETEVKGQPKC